MITQINSDGEITISPIRILLSHNVSRIGTIFFDDSKRLHILASNGDYYRFIINYKDLVSPSAKPSRLVSTNVSGFFWHSVFVTSGLNQNFFMASSPITHAEPCIDDELLISYQLDDSTGRLLPKSWKIFPEELPSGSCLNQSKLASKDGKIAWFAGTKLPQFKRIFYFQELGPQGKPKNKAFQIPGFSAHNAELTNVLQNGTRLIAYVTDRVGGGGDDYPDDVFVRTIQLTDRKLGPRYKVNAGNTFIADIKSIVIDPKGRFVLFALYDYPEDLCNVFYRALDPNTGKPIGKIRKLLADVCGPLHLVEDPNSSHN
jgi:hypothetical protein